MAACTHLDVVLQEDGVVVGACRVERLGDGGDEPPPLDAVVHRLHPVGPVDGLELRQKNVASGAG